MPQYLIVNLRRDVVEVYEQPVAERASYAVTRVARRGERIVVVDFPALSLAVADLLPTTPKLPDPILG